MAQQENLENEVNMESTDWEWVEGGGYETAVIEEDGEKCTLILLKPSMIDECAWIVLCEEHAEGGSASTATQAKEDAADMARWLIARSGAGWGRKVDF